MRRILALALVPIFALAACSSPATTATTAAPATSAPATSAPATTSPSASTSPDAPANTGPTLKGDGYTLALPEGWKEATADFKKLQASVDTGGKNNSDTKDGFTDNVNVIAQASAEIPFDQLKTAIQKQLEGAGSKNIEFKENAQLDGAEALQVWSTTKGAGDAHTIQFMAFKDSKIFVVTVSSNLSTTKADSLAQQVISGWKWA